MKKEDDIMPPYTLKKMKVTTQCIDTEVLENKGLYLFKGEFHILEGKKVQMITLPNSFQRLGREEEFQTIYNKLVIENYFKLLP